MKILLAATAALAILVGTSSANAEGLCDHLVGTWTGDQGTASRPTLVQVVMTIENDCGGEVEFRRKGKAKVGHAMLIVGQVFDGGFRYGQAYDDPISDRVRNTLANFTATLAADGKSFSGTGTNMNLGGELVVSLVRDAATTAALNN